MQKCLFAIAAFLLCANTAFTQTEQPLELSATVSNRPSFILTDPKEVLKHEGELISVEGCVVSAKLKDRIKGKPIFLDMFAAYPDNLFTVAIWETDQPEFLAAADYHQKIVRITGRLEKEEVIKPGKANLDRYTISLHDPKQITILGDCR